MITELSRGRWSICHSMDCREQHWPVMDGLGLAQNQQLSRHGSPGTSPDLIFVCLDADDPMLPHALSRGAVALVSSVDANGEWEAAVREVVLGGRWISPVVAPRFLDPRWVLGHRVSVTGVDRLTPAQREILNLMITGMTRAEVAVRLSIQESTVAYHIRRGLQRLACRNIRELQARIIRQEIGSSVLDNHGLR